jgi:hypothetical protein
MIARAAAQVGTLASLGCDVIQRPMCGSAQRSSARKGDDAGMNITVTKGIGILLIAAGALGLLYGGFSYTKESHSATVGPFVLKVQEKETVVVPLILSAGAIALGVFLLIGFRNK